MKKEATRERRSTPIHALVQATLAEDLARVRSLLGAHPRLLREPGSWEPLIVAARKGLCEIASLLLDHGAGPNAPGDYGPDSAHTGVERPLHWAAGHGQHEMVRLLLERGAEVDGCLERFTPLQSAARAGQKPICDTLLARGARMSVFVCAAMGTLDEMHRLLQENPSLVNAQDEYGTPPLYIAAELWRLEMVRLLLERGADLSLTDRHRDGVLHLLAIRRFDPVLVWRPPLPPNGMHLLDEQQQTATAALLVEAGADVNARNWRKLTPLHRAVRAGRIGYVRFLLDHGADVNAVDVAGDTPLSRAVTQAERLPVAELLIQRGADLGITTKRGKGLLELARGKEMKELLQHQRAL